VSTPSRSKTSRKADGTLLTGHIVWNLIAVGFGYTSLVRLALTAVSFGLVAYAQTLLVTWSIPSLTPTWEHGEHFTLSSRYSSNCLLTLLRRERRRFTLTFSIWDKGRPAPILSKCRGLAVASPVSFMSNSSTRTSIVTATVTTAPTWVKLLATNPLRIGLQVVPQFGGSGLDAIGGSTFIASKAVVPSGVTTQLSVSAGIGGYDDDDYLANVALNEITIPSSGNYLIAGTIGYYLGGVATTIGYYLSINGVQYVQSAVSEWLQPASSPYANVVVLCQPKCNAGDKVTFFVEQSTGAGINVIGTMSISAIGGIPSVTPVGFPYPPPGLLLPTTASSPSIDAGDVAGIVDDTLQNVYISWNIHAPLPTYNWFYSIQSNGTYSWYILETILNNDPCPPQPPPDLLNPPYGYGWGGAPTMGSGSQPSGGETMGGGTVLTGPTMGGGVIDLGGTMAPKPQLPEE
jgi:hypothetical protein